MKPRDPIDQDLRALKKTMDEQLLSDFDGHRLRRRIRHAIAAEEQTRAEAQTRVDAQASADRRSHRYPYRPSRWSWRRLGPFAAGAVALCVVLAGVVFYSGKPGQISVTPAGPTSVTENPGVFSTGFQPIVASDAKQFQHVTQITLLLGNGWGFQTPDSVDGATLTLTDSQQQTFYHIMQSSQRKNVSSPVLQSTALPFSIMFSTSNGQEQMAFQGYYSASGAMVLGNQVYAQNPALAQFVNQYLMSQLLNKYKKAGKLLSTSVNEAALGFVQHLSHPWVAYQYCVPNMVFDRGTDLRSLQRDAKARGFADFQITTIAHGPGDADATVVLRHRGRFWASAITLNLVRIQDTWFVIQAGLGTHLPTTSSENKTQSSDSQTMQAPGNPYDGITPVVPFGQYHTLIIGPSVGLVRPTGNTSYGKQGHYTAITYQDLNAPAYQTAQIIVYERTPLTKDSSETDAATALQADPAFQKAVSEAKARHAVLVVTGGADNLLSRNMVVKALGNIESTTGYETKPDPSATITVWFQGADKALFTGITPVQNGGKHITYLDPMLLDESINQAALLHDTWGSVLN